MCKAVLLSRVSLLAVLLLSLAACNASKSPTVKITETIPIKATETIPVKATETVPVIATKTIPATATVETAERVPIRWFIGIGTGRSSSQMAAAQAFVKEFNASQNRIELILEAVTTNSHDAVDHLLAEIEAGTAPDLAAPSGTWGMYQFPEYILPPDSLLGTIDLSDMDPQDLRSWQEGGNTIGFPLGVSPSFLFYKKNLFDKAGLPYPPHPFEEPYADGDPWTIEKMEAIASQLTLDVTGKNALDADFDAGHVIQWGFHWQWDSTISMAVMFGPGSVVGENGTAVMPQHWREAFHWYYAGMWEKHFIPTMSQTDNMQGNPFTSGKIAMVSSFLWYAPRIPNLQDWDLAAVPAYNGKITTRVERNGVSILKTSQHPAEAFEVAVAIANSPELLAAWGVVPAFQSLRPKMIAELKAQVPEVDWQVVLDSMSYGDNSYENSMPNYRRAYDRLLEFKDLMAGSQGLDLDAEIDRLTSELQTIFDE
jgi:multiple sugar transport system substrate-binding protein